MSIQHDIKAFRASRGLTRAEFGALFGAVPESVKRWESGSQAPSPRVRRKIETALASDDGADPVRAYWLRHAAACRAVFRDLRGTATPADLIAADHVRRHGYPSR